MKKKFSCVYGYEKAVFAFILSLVSSGCDNFFSDAIWVQQSNVTINDSKSDECLIAALSSNPNITIDHTLTVPGDIALNVELKKKIPSLNANIRHVNKNVIQIMFIGKGLHESNEDRTIITPLLESVVTSIRKTCS